MTEKRAVSSSRSTLLEGLCLALFARQEFWLGSLCLSCLLPLEHLLQRHRTLAAAVPVLLGLCAGGRLLIFDFTIT